MLLLSGLVRKVVQSAVCWSVKSHYTERQIGSISLPPYANPAQPAGRKREPQECRKPCILSPACRIIVPIERTISVARAY